MADWLPQLSQEQLEICRRADAGEISRQEAFELMFGRENCLREEDYLLSEEIVNKLDFVYVGAPPFRDNPIKGIEVL